MRTHINKKQDYTYELTQEYKKEYTHEYTQKYTQRYKQEYVQTEVMGVPEAQEYTEVPTPTVF